jgi:hypothetical protein
LYYTTKRSRSAAQTTMMVSGGFCLSGQRYVDLDITYEHMLDDCVDS